MKKISWTLHNCSEELWQLEDIRKCFPSPIFDVPCNDLTTKWSLVLCPHGGDIRGNGYMNFFLILKEASTLDFIVHFKFGIARNLKETGKDNYMSSLRTKTGQEFQDCGGFGCGLMYKKLFNHEDYLCDDGNVTLICELLFQTTSEDNDDKAVSTLAMDFRNMLDKKLFTDFQIQTNDGQVLNANKAVLSARSPVFNAMLKNEMTEAKTGLVFVPDFDSKVMKLVLQFIYCDLVEGSNKTAAELVYAAEKYQLEELKQRCLNTIGSALSINNVAQAILIANRVSNATSLFNKCVRFLSSNYDTISATEEWKQLPGELVIKVQNQIIKRICPTFI